MVNIRLTELNDLQSINRISQSLGYPPLDQDVAKSNLETLIDSPTDQVWVFQKNLEILGWIHVFIANRVASKPFLEIGGIVADPQYRRIGIGRQLVDKAIQWAEEKDITLRVRCNATRKETFQFYRSINFHSIKQQQVFEFIQ